MDDDESHDSCCWSRRDWGRLCASLVRLFHQLHLPLAHGVKVKPCKARGGILHRTIAIGKMISAIFMYILSSCDFYVTTCIMWGKVAIAKERHSGVRLWHRL